MYLNTSTFLNILTTLIRRITALAVINVANTGTNMNSNIILTQLVIPAEVATANPILIGMIATNPIPNASLKKDKSLSRTIWVDDSGSVIRSSISEDIYILLIKLKKPNAKIPMPATNPDTLRITGTPPIISMESANLYPTYPKIKDIITPPTMNINNLEESPLSEVLFLLSILYKLRIFFMFNTIQFKKYLFKVITCILLLESINTSCKLHLSFLNNKNLIT